MSAREVSIIDLIKISNKLVPIVFTTHDFYTLLVLSLATVSEYSRVKQTISKKTRVNLSIAFISDLITNLCDRHLITETEAHQFRQDYKDKNRDLGNIIRAYISVANTIHPHCTTQPKPKSTLCLLQ